MSAKPVTVVEIYFTVGVATNVSTDVNHITIRRGNDSQLFADTNAGTAIIQLNNEDRRYDSEYASSPHFGKILPNRVVVITSGGVVIFTGKTDDWDYTYDVGGRSVVVVKCVDGLATLARQEMDEHTAVNGQLPGARITEVLDRADVQWSASLRDIDAGVNVLQGNEVALFTNVLGYLNTIAKSDVGGYIYMSRTGVFTFRDRHSALMGATPSTLSFTDTGAANTVPWRSIETVNGSELLFNRISVLREGAAPVTVLAIDSQLEYGIRVYNTPSLLLQDSDQALDAAAYLTTVYEEPAYRVQELAIETRRIAPASQVDVLELDMSSVITVSFTPNDVGSAITATLLVAGISHEISVANHVVTLNFAVGIIQTGDFWQPGVAVFGVFNAGTGATNYPIAF